MNIAIVLLAAFLLPLSCAAEDVANIDAKPSDISSKDQKITEQAKQLESMRQQQEFQAQQIREMQLQRQATEQQTYQQAKDSQLLRYQVGHHSLLRNLIFDPPFRVKKPQAVQPSP